MKKNYQKLSVGLHKEKRGKLEVVSKVPLKNKNDLSLAYTPGVAGPCLEIAKHRESAYGLTTMKNAVAVVSDGSAVLGLGNIGPEASLPVMEGKALLFKNFAGVDAFPVVLATQDVDEIVEAVRAIAPTYGGINLEDISAPRCFEIEERLKRDLSIPVMHDDQHGTAIVVLAGLINALKVVGKSKSDIRVVINGAGSAGIATTKLLYKYGVRHILLCDSKGIISEKRAGLSLIKKEALKITNKEGLSGTLQDALVDRDVFIGVSRGDLLRASDIKTMAERAVVVALANPVPEIMPTEAKRGGAAVVATGRSDFPNQINNVLAFPGVFKGAIESRAKVITGKMKVAAAEALARVVEKPSATRIVPNPFDKKVVEAVSKAVTKLAR